MAVVGLGLLAWAAGIGGTRGWLGKGLGAAAIAGLLVWSWPRELPAQSVARSETGAVSAAGDWLAYDETVLADLAMRNKPVFVDFTAAWCVSCQVNKRLVLHTDDTLQAFAAAQVTLMQADWTRRDPVITAALARLGRNGVPVYVLFRPGLEPLLLPEILSPGIVRDALASLQDPRS
jgi:thiol:disulfide interchange protein DsbD